MAPLKAVGLGKKAQPLPILKSMSGVLRPVRMLLCF
jgi:hypothetical protein